MNIDNIIAQLTASQSSLSSSAPAQSQGSASASNGSGGNSPAQSFKTALNNAAQPAPSSQPSQPAQSGQVLPTAQNNTQNISVSAAGSQSTQPTITANPGFANLAALLGNLVQEQNPQAQPQTASNSAPQPTSTTDNLLINGNTGNQNNGSQANITSPEALLQFMLARNATLLASNNNTQNGSSIPGSPINANASNADNTTQPITAPQPQKSQAANINDPTSLASILAQISPALNFAANSQALANPSGNAANLSINPNASSGSNLARILTAQAATIQQNQPSGNAASNIKTAIITGQQNQPAIVTTNNAKTGTITSQQNQSVSDATNNASANQAVAANLQALTANQKTALQNFALAYASNATQGQSAKPTTKLVSESKIPDFSSFSNQVFAVKTDIKTAVPANSALNNAANDENNNNISNAVAALDKTDGAQLKSAAVKEDDADTVEAANASQQSQPKTDIDAVKTAPANPATDTVKYQTPAEQVVFQIAAAAKDGNSKIRIQLEPADLGKISVEMNMNSDGKLNLNITADKSSTLTMLQGDSKSLEKSLNDIGFKSDATNLSFNLRQGGNGSQPQNWTYQNYGTTTASNQDTAEVTVYSALPSMLTSNQALDIRV